MSTSANNDPSCYYWVRDDDRDFITTPDGEVVNIARLTAYAEYGDEIFDKHAHHEIPLGKITAPRFIDALSPEEHGRLHGNNIDPVEVDGIPLLRLDP